MVGSTQFTLPGPLPGALPGDPLPDPPNEYTFFIDGGDVSQTDYMSVCTIVLRDDVANVGFDPPYRRGTVVGSQLNSLFPFVGGSIQSVTDPGGNNTAPVPPPMEPQPLAANDVIITAFTYQGKGSYGNPLGDGLDVIDADTTNVRMYSMGLYGNEADGSELGYHGIVNNNVEPEGWNTVGFDDSGWMTPASRSNTYGSHEPVTVLGLPYTTSANPWVIPHAPIQYERVLWRMEFSLAGGGIHELDHTLINGFAAQMNGPMFLAVAADPILQPNAYAAQSVEDGDVPGDRWQLDGGHIGAYLQGPNQYRTSIDGLPFDWFWATGVAHYVPAIVYGATYCLSGEFFTWQSPDWVADTNPGGIQIRVEVIGTSFDGDSIGGLTDLTSVSAFDPPLQNLISVRQEALDSGFHTWILTRDLWVQTAGQRAEQGLPITYGFDRIPPFLPYPPADGVNTLSYGFGTGFSFVWQDGGPSRAGRGAGSSIQLVG
jgi:hypothetical protein